MLIPAIGMLLSGLMMLLFYNLSDMDARMMSKCVAGEISRDVCESHLHAVKGKDAYDSKYNAKIL